MEVNHCQYRYTPKSTSDSNKNGNNTTINNNNKNGNKSNNYTEKKKNQKPGQRVNNGAINLRIEAHETPRFEVNDPEGYKYLEDFGYVIFKNVANEEERKKGISFAWDYLENLLEGVNRNDPLTWDHAEWPDPFRKGILSGDGVGQSEFLWHCRSIPNVKAIYSQIWGTQALATSFDGFCLHRPFEYNENWRTKEGWYHLDQNGINKPDRVCIQGFLNFYPGGVDDGGLVVVPKSHLIFNEIFKEFPQLGRAGDFIRLDSHGDFWNGIAKRENLKPLKVCCQPGDFVLWDSRTIHCNAPAKTSRQIPKEGFLEPRRVVAYICMTPIERINEKVLGSRINAYLTGQTTSHWPEECFTPKQRKNTKKNYQPVELSPEQKEMIPM